MAMKIFKNIKRTQIFTLFFFICDMLCLYAFIEAIQVFVNNVVAGISFDPDHLFLFGGLLSGMILCGLCAQYGFHILPVLGKKKILEYYEKLLMEEDHSFFEEHSAAYLLSLFQNEISLFGQQSVTLPVVFIYQTFSLIAGAGLLIMNEWRLALILFLLIGICFSLTHVLSKKIAGTTQKVYQRKNRLFQILHENIEMHRLIRFLNKEVFFSFRFDQELEDHLIPLEEELGSMNAQYITIYSILSRALPLLGAGIGLVFATFGWMGVGNIISTYALMSLIQEPIMQLAEIRTQKHTIRTLKETIDRVFANKFVKSEQSYENESPIQKIDVQIDHFCYQDSPEILKDLSFSIDPGQHTRLSGPSGAGKSTLMNLFMGVLSGEETHLSFNEIKSTSFSKAWRARHILMVDQKPKLFTMSVLGNITLGDHFSQKELDEIIHTCVLEEIMSEHENTILHDENGLSQGQAQRVSIARMLIRKPDVLILDEPISALDERTASLFISRLKTYAEHYHLTLIISSHNDQIDPLCAQTIHLKKIPS